MGLVSKITPPFTGPHATQTPGHSFRRQDSDNFPQYQRSNSIDFDERHKFWHLVSSNVSARACDNGSRPSRPMHTRKPFFVAYRKRSYFLHTTAISALYGVKRMILPREEESPEPLPRPPREGTPPPPKELHYTREGEPVRNARLK
jgi:hypothetical protein